MIGVFLIHNFNSDIGGMEVHQRAFISHYFSNPDLFKVIVERDNGNYVIHHCDIFNNDIYNNRIFFTSVANVVSWIFQKYPSDNYLFFLNDTWWIEDIEYLRKKIPSSRIIMRSGGNDVEKAPWSNAKLTYEQRRVKIRECIQQLDAIVANSSFSLQRLINLGISSEKIITIRGGVDTKTISKIKAIGAVDINERELVRNPQFYRILFACRFVDFKGVKEALVALSQSAICDKVQIVLLGSGPLYDSINLFCDQHFKREQFSILGAVDNKVVLNYMVASDLFINLSLNVSRQCGDGHYIHTETMGRSMMEAISAGTHILATDVGGTKEIFDENGPIGRLIKPDIASMIEAFNQIEQYTSSPVVLRQDYSWDCVFHKYDEIFTH